MQHSPLLSFWKLSSILALTSRSYGEKAPASFTDHIGNVRGSSKGARQQVQRVRGARAGKRLECAPSALFTLGSCTLFHTI